jgi:hypothetical protein
LFTTPAYPHGVLGQGRHRGARRAPDFDLHGRGLLGQAGPPPGARLRYTYNQALRSLAHPPPRRRSPEQLSKLAARRTSRALRSLPREPRRGARRALLRQALTPRRSLPATPSPARSSDASRPDGRLHREAPVQRREPLSRRRRTPGYAPSTSTSLGLIRRRSSRDGELVILGAEGRRRARPAPPRRAERPC